MGLADEIASSQELLFHKSKTAICTMRLILDYLDDKDKEALESLMRDRRVFGTSISDLLQSWSHKITASLDDESIPDDRRPELEHLAQLCGNISDGIVQRHRRGKCLCIEEA